MWEELGCALTRNHEDLGSGDGKGADVLPSASAQAGTTDQPAAHRSQKVRGKPVCSSEHTHQRQSSLPIHRWSNLHREIRVALSTAMMCKHVKWSTSFPCKSLHLYNPGMQQSEAGSKTGGWNRRQCRCSCNSHPQRQELYPVAENYIPYLPDGNWEVMCSGSGDTEKEHFNLLLISAPSGFFYIWVGFFFTDAGVVYFGIYSLESKGCARDAASFGSPRKHLWIWHHFQNLKNPSAACSIKRPQHTSKAVPQPTVNSVFQI